ncbi:MAG: phosphoribosylformylglycinamidine synthase subunit PurS [Aminobacterium sp.]|jgi:phosphoribosylformylglycinamidine synthase PurS subunit|uniref:phosphoribosylformylglycinamidine synthase subunit PurS n=1 Tax=unclassified Aminobacterium TaxID=2685012 RepID=UPI001BCE3819|nr:MULTISPECIES: phosphoribosylformylglycinamidine synthase subunit PurS [unclassified Aminobacterium]MDD2205770.1 phosphoribosylformylglycinamidine synthase subunit PurS [Aminobacterium sp.]MDD3426865.1 phosphoribosylformylglycinamidine synthase subunit PurS [Aminobacterium sp.]MDD3708201.1 phosphoribosylformylglycinamidine synthase subunit PurS [Aminobacterium sp.]MDD4229257.1 phosphoribosylformylglycinamidine synthase subunit PurS [Aminobacterium sp.]MDD4550960.1 phosphoribosylformylglycina
MSFLVKLLIYPKEGVLDTQGKAVASSLTSLGYTALKSVRVGRYIQLSINSDTAEDARKQVENMCDDLLVNSLIEDFSIIAVEA